jgi:hypothetical protein
MWRPFPTPLKREPAAKHHDPPALQRWGLTVHVLPGTMETGGA